MRLHEALENERQRIEPQSWNKIFLHKDGKFLHAYEWSAWLIKTFVCTEEFQRQRGDKNMLAASRYQTKDNEYVILGFPLESLSKYIPDYRDMTPIEDDLILDIDFPSDMEVSFDSLAQAFGEWKKQCPVKEKKQKPQVDMSDNRNLSPIEVQNGMFNILSRILAYPLESKTLIENTQFLSSLKSEISKLL